MTSPVPNAAPFDDIRLIRRKPQLVRLICERLLRLVEDPHAWLPDAARDLPILWRDDAPTEAFDDLCHRLPELPTVPRALLSFVRALRTGLGGPTVADILALDDAHREAVVSILDAVVYGDERHLKAVLSVTTPDVLYCEGAA